MTPDVIVSLGPSVCTEPNQRVVALSESQQLDPEPFFADLPHELDPGDSVALECPAGMRESDPERLQYWLHGLSRAMAVASASKSVAVLRSELVVRNVIANLGRLHLLSLLDIERRPLAGQTVFILAAGPSLELQGEWLHVLSQYGFVMAVNSSVNYLESLGTFMHASVCVESVDAEDQFGYADPAYELADLSANVHNVADMVFVAAQPAWSWIARALGVRPVPYTGNVSAAAFSLAVGMGASEIVLLGHDFAYTGRRVHAGDRRVVVADYCRGRVVLPVRKESDARYQKAGLPVPGREHRLELVPAIGPGTVVTTPTLTSFRQWLERSARLLRASGSSVRLVNATAAGARIAGFEPRSLESLLGRRMPNPRSIGLDRANVTPNIERVQRLLQDVGADAARTRVLASAVLKARDTHVPQLQRWCRQTLRASPLVECYAVPALDRAMSAPPDGMRKRRERIYTAIRDAATAVERLAEEAMP